ncbi:MAG: hypothetical protein ACOYJQ_09265 [Pseudochelatococcus sp.]|jgi:hypothetical protein|uniref:hypothetical protein n=1 Tax=Pseudochelatococcus sp. TaxID=2020869 RepID=UPI003D9363BE
MNEKLIIDDRIPPTLPLGASSLHVKATQQDAVAKRDSFNGFMLISVLISLVGYLLFMSFEVRVLFYIGCALLCISCGQYAIKSLFRRKLNTGALITSQTMLWYALPFSYIGFFGYEYYIWNALEIDNAETVAIIILVSYILYFIFDRYGKEITIPDVEIRFNSCALLLLPILLSQLYMVIAGQRGYANVVGVGQTQEEASQLYQFTVALSTSVMPLCAVMLAKILIDSENRQKLARLMFCISALLVQFLWWTTAGRRAMTILAIISVVSFFSIYYKRKLTERKIFMIIAFSIVFVPAVWYLWESYYLLRLATTASRGAENLSIMDLGRAQELTGGLDMDSAFTNNVIKRPFSLPTSVTVVRETASGFLYGWNTLSQLLLSIPSAFFPGKFDFIGPVGELLWFEALGVPLTDWSNTLFIESYIDFGVFGLFIYIIIISALMRLTLWIARGIGWDVVIWFTYFNLAFFMLSIEASANTIFVGFRSAFIALFIAFVVRIIANAGGVKLRRGPRLNHRSVQ